MEARAVLKYTGMSPQKVRLVVDLIRGKKAEEALTILSFCNKVAASAILKLLRSAIANAENASSVDVDSLYIKRVYVDDGPRRKKLNPKAMGRANIIRSKTSHITIVLDEL